MAARFASACAAFQPAASEAMSCARPLLISLAPELFDGRFTVFPPVMNVAEPDQIAAALTQLIDDRNVRAQLGERAREWVVQNHGQALARKVLELCQAAVTEAPPRRTRRAG